MKSRIFALFVFVLLSVLLSFQQTAFANEEKVTYSISRFEMGIFSSKWGEPQDVEVAEKAVDGVVFIKYPKGMQKFDTKNLIISPLMSSEADLSQVLIAGGQSVSLTVGTTWENELSAPPALSSRCPHPVTSKVTSEVSKAEGDFIEISQKGTWTSLCGSGTGQARMVISRNLKITSFETSSFMGSRQVAGTRLEKK